MLQVRRAAALAAAVLLFAAACSDGQPAATRAADGVPAPSFGMSARPPRDVPEVRIDLPPRARAWDNNPAALAQAVSAGDGYAVVAFKEPGSARALATGKRGAVTAGTVTAGLQLLRQRGAEVLEVLDAIGAARVRVSPRAAADLAGHPLVDFVEPRQYGRVQAQATPANVSMVLAPEFWSASSVTGAGVKIEIIDTGHQQGHPDLPAITACLGIFGGCDDNATVNWHGTHVLGIVAARDNAEGVVGVAPGLAASDIYMYGACDSAGRCPTDEVTAGINAGLWNAQVMNLSLVQPFDLAQSTAVGQAWTNGIVLVAAAGNNLTNTVTYPAGYANVVGVSGVLPDKSFASSATPSACDNYSNQGTHVDLAAPMEAYSTIGDGGYGTLCGTSMAAAHVTGVVALLKSQNPTWTSQQIVDSLFARAEDLGPAGKDNQFGHGLVRPAGPVPLAAAVSGPGTISAAGTYAWSAIPSGGAGTYAFTWEYRPQGSATWTQVGTGSAYSRAVSGPEDSFELRATVTSGADTVSATHAVAVVFPPVPSISGPASVTSAGTKTWSAAVTGGDGTNSYSWQYRAHGASSWTTVGTAASYSRSVSPGNASFELRVTVVSGGMSGTDTHSVSVAPATSISGTASISSPGSHAWSASASGGSGGYTYSWQYRLQGGSTWTTVGSGSSYARTVTSSQAPFELRVTVTSGGFSASDTHLVSVVFPPVATIAGPTSVSAAGTQTWTANVTGGNGTNAYSWEYRPQGGAWTSVGTGSSYSRYVAPGAAQFELRVTVTSGGFTSSDTQLVGVAPGANITGALYVTVASTHTWQPNPSGGNGIYTYRWDYRAQGTVFWTQVGTGSTYTRSLGTGNPSFELRVTVTSGGLSSSDIQQVDLNIN